MSVTNAISSVVMVGAILAAGSETIGYGSILGGIAVALVATNTFGGFMVTQRMLQMFKKKDRSTAQDKDGGRVSRPSTASGRPEQAEGRSGPAE